jgi:hypothetical protein
MVKECALSRALRHNERAMKVAPFVLALVPLSVASVAYAEPPKVSATCERAAGPGRVRCEAELVVNSGVVRWADVQIVETPPFVTALKGRIGPADTTLREKDKWRFSFGLVARARGTGDVRLQFRAVVCEKLAASGGEERCEATLLSSVVSVVSGA